MKLLKSFLVGIIFSLLTVLPVSADCILNDTVYPEGSRVGDKFCHNGKWV